MANRTAKKEDDRDLFDVIAHETATLWCILSVLETGNDGGPNEHRLSCAEAALRYTIERLEGFTGEIENMQDQLRKLRKEAGGEVDHV